MQPEQQQRIMGYFIEEAKDHLNTIEQGLLNLQSTIEDPEMVNEMFRAAHSVKGGAAMLGLTSIQRVGHRLEDFFKVIKESPIKADQQLETLFLRVFDALQELLGQLQSPFGLTADAANATVAAVEPTFVELEKHLNALVGSAPAPAPAIATPAERAMPVSMATFIQEDSALALLFKSDVPVHLREMLQLFKQSDGDPEVRQQLQSICQKLLSIGEQFDLPVWCSLLTMTQQAIANPETSYRTLAPIVIRDIKQAQELVLANRESEICPCDQLRALVPTIPVAAPDEEFLNFLSIDDAIAEETLEDDTIASSAGPDLFDAVGSSEFDLGDSLDEELSVNLRGRTGPEVGMAELNSLADLFEGEVPELGSTWQDEEIVGEMPSLSSSEPAPEFDPSSDFSDLLFEETSSADSSPMHSGLDDDLNDLFGDALLEEPDPTPIVTAAPSNEQDDLDEFLSFGDEPIAATSNLDDLDNTDFNNLGLDNLDDLGFSDALSDDLSPLTDSTVDDDLRLDTATPDSTTAPLSNLGDWFADMDEQDLGLTSKATEVPAESIEPATPASNAIMSDPWNTENAFELPDAGAEPDLLAELENLPTDTPEPSAAIPADLETAASSELDADLGDLFDLEPDRAELAIDSGNDALNFDLTSSDGTDSGLELGGLFEDTQPTSSNETVLEDLGGLEDLPGLEELSELESLEAPENQLEELQLEELSQAGEPDFSGLFGQEPAAESGLEEGLEELTDLTAAEDFDFSSSDWLNQANTDAIATPTETPSSFTSGLGDELSLDNELNLDGELSLDDDLNLDDELDEGELDGLDFDLALTEPSAELPTSSTNADSNPFEPIADPWEEPSSRSIADSDFFNLDGFETLDTAEADAPLADLATPEPLQSDSLSESLAFESSGLEDLSSLDNVTGLEDLSGFESLSGLEELTDSAAPEELVDLSGDLSEFDFGDATPAAASLEDGLDEDLWGSPEPEPPSIAADGFDITFDTATNLEATSEAPQPEMVVPELELSLTDETLLDDAIGFDAIDFAALDPTANLGDASPASSDSPIEELRLDNDLDASSGDNFDFSGLAFDATPEPSSANLSLEETASSDLDFNSLGLGDLNLESEGLEGLGFETSEPDSFGLEGFGSDSFEAANPETENFQLESLAPDSLGLNNLESSSLGSDGLESFSLESLGLEGLEVESPESAGLGSDNFELDSLDLENFGLNDLESDRLTTENSAIDLDEFNLEDIPPISAIQGESNSDTSDPPLFETHEINLFEEAPEPSSESLFQSSADLGLFPDSEMENSLDFSDLLANGTPDSATSAETDSTEESAGLVDVTLLNLDESDELDSIDLFGEPSQTNESAEFDFGIPEAAPNAVPSFDLEGMGLDDEFASLGLEDDRLSLGTDEEPIGATQDSIAFDSSLFDSESDASGDAFGDALGDAIELDAALLDELPSGDSSIPASDAEELGFGDDLFGASTSSEEPGSSNDLDDLFAIGSGEPVVEQDLGVGLDEMGFPIAEDALDLGGSGLDDSDANDLELNDLGFDNAGFFDNAGSDNTGLGGDALETNLGLNSLETHDFAANFSEANADQTDDLGLNDLEFNDLELNGLGLDNLDQTPGLELNSLDFDRSIEPEEPEIGNSFDSSLDLDDLLTDAAAPQSLTDESLSDAGLSDLDDLLGDSLEQPDDLMIGSNFGEADDRGDNSFADLDDLLGGESPTSAASEDEFGDLDALLAGGAVLAGGAAIGHSLTSPSTPNSSNDFGLMDDFADLEALLEGEATPGIPTAPTPAIPASDPDFDELDDLLKDAEEKMGGSPSVKVSRGQPPQARKPRGPFDQTMRVPVKHLDNLSNLVGELVVNRNSLEQDQERLRQSLDNLLYQVQQLSDVGQRMQDLYERSLLESSLLASRQNYRMGGNTIPAHADTSTQTASTTEMEYDPLEMDRFTGFHSLSQEMIELIVRVRESASDIEFIVDETDQVTRMFRQVTTQLQEGLTRSRMVPFAQTADRLPRAVRDISMKVGKQAELVIEGRETLIDKMILEQLYDPMTHLVNNAITHGIESPDVRRSAGKSPAGRITIRAFHQGNQTIISVSDDGAGIDVERVKRKAIEKGLITPAEAHSISRLDVYDLLFHPGFSTADEVGDFSGRGVGMDVVRTSLSEIRGVINTDSTSGKGTTFTIRLPLTLSISKALCCISDRARIAFPMDGVEDMLDVPKERIQTNSEGQPCISWRDSLLPLRPLTELLGYNRHLSRGNVYGGNQEDDIISIVVLRSAGNFLALQVDQVLGEQEIVIKQLEGPVPKPIGVAGATVLGDGRIMPIADVLELIDLSMGRIRKDVSGSLWEKGSGQNVQEPPAIKTEPTVLIVDDSITVRELLSMTFNKVGYRVEQARDGQEAWEKLRAGLPCDIVFCDIEMPRMDGLELLSRIQKDVNLNHLPIAMLTSRGADRHRQMASSLGASGYFTKPYLEEALLDAAQRMLKGERLL